MLFCRNMLSHRQQIYKQIFGKIKQQQLVNIKNFFKILKTYILKI